MVETVGNSRIGVSFSKLVVGISCLDLLEQPMSEAVIKMKEKTC